jgi:hypothetical protein
MIEKDIQDLTAAINNLIAALNNRSLPAQPVAETKPVAEEPKPKAKKTAEAEAETATAETPKIVLSAVPTAAEPVITGPVTQADLRDVASKLLAQKRLPDILRINKEHGIRRITECPAEKYEAVYASLNAALADAAGS